MGNIIKVRDNEEIPCDMVMLSSEDENGECSITTANLDGETNLKVMLIFKLWYFTKLTETSVILLRTE